MEQKKASRSGLRLHKEILRALDVEELADVGGASAHCPPVGQTLDGTCLVEPAGAQRGNLTHTAGGDGT
jgi:hypothetical protein